MSVLLNRFHSLPSQDGLFDHTVDSDPHARNDLGDHRSLCRSFYTAIQHCHKDVIQYDIQHRAHAEKDKRQE